jgi:catechol 2,3-dioxygenase-like lactoylglutathione lyase family enzyme
VITGIRSVNVKVRDQQRARAFWVDAVGLRVVSDVPMPDFPGRSWLETAGAADDTLMVLHWPVFAEAEFFSGITFLCDDVQQTFAELSGNGVEFVAEPVHARFGWWATFRDLDGNVYVLREEPAGAFAGEGR